jgi:hypothetical protein
MNDLTKRERDDLDRHITGNHGEDSVPPEPNQRVRLEGHGEFWLVKDALAPREHCDESGEIKDFETAITADSYAHCYHSQNVIKRYGKVIAKVTDLQPIEEFSDRSPARSAALMRCGPRMIRIPASFVRTVDSFTRETSSRGNHEQDFVRHWSGLRGT